MLRSLARRSVPLVAVAVVLSFLTMSLAQFGDPQDGSGGPADFVQIPIGTNQFFYKGPFSGNMQPFNWVYLGVNETTCSAQQPPVGAVENLCEGSIHGGQANITQYIPTGVAARTLDSRAGVGLGYEFVPRCANQSTLLRPLWINASVSAGIGGVAPSGSGTGWVDAWLNFDQGRGGSSGEGTSTPAGTVGNTSVYLGRMDASRLAEWGTFSKQDLVTPSGPQAFLTYLHGHASTSGPSQWEETYGIIILNSLTFQWHDDQAPTVGVALSRPDGGALGAPATGYSGTPWYREPVRIVWTLDDDFSCPRYLDMDTGRFPVDFNKSPIVEDDNVDREYVHNGLAFDWAGNYVQTTTIYGVDRVPPAPGLAVDPPQPSGANGWYNASAPAFLVVSCSDVGSGCHHVALTASGWSDTTYAPFPQRARAPEGNLTYSCTAYDESKLSNSSCSIHAAYDGTAPFTTPYCSPFSRFGGDSVCPSSLATFRLAPQQVRITCADSTSGCWYENVSVDSVPLPPVVAPASDTFLNVTSEGPHWLNVTVTDRAGNVRTDARAFTLDATPPAKAQAWETHNATYVSASPTWHFVSSDALSGVGSFDVYLDGAFKGNFGPAGWYNASGLSEGQHCLYVVPYDVAGNAGPASDPACAFLDTTKPVVALSGPQARTAYKDGAPWLPASGDFIVALGKVPITASASDPGAPASGSGLADFRMLLNGADWTPLEGSDACPASGASCTRTYQASNGGYGNATLSAKATDAAGNWQAKASIVDVVDLLALSSAEHPMAAAATPRDASATYVPYAEAWWVPANVPGTFVEYDVSRSPTKQTAGGTAFTIATITDPAVDHYHDANLLPGTTYWYRVTTVWRDAAGATHSSPSVPYEAQTPPAGTQPSTPIILQRG